MIWPVGKTLLDPGNISSLRLYDHHGVLLREILSDQEGRGAWVSLRDISPLFKTAIVAVEDKKFYSHPGIDLPAIARAAWDNFSQGEIVSGGSTITQQIARQLYHLPRRWYAKPVEALLALRLELWLSKDAILEQYLNRVPFGNQTYGVESASRLYFDKPAAHLSLSEAAFLAGLPQSPSQYNPYRHFDRAKKRQLIVLQAMMKQAVLDSAGFRQARQTELKIFPAKARFLAPHFCEMVLSNISPAQKTHRDILTSLDYGLQSRIETLVAGHLKNLAAENVTNAAVLVMENKTNEIRVWIGSQDFFDEKSQGQMDGVTSLRQPGSALKPFTYGLALENGYTAASILPDIETFATTTGGDFSVHNYDETFHGPVRLRTALACSYNVPAVRTLETLGADLLLSRLRMAGIKSLDKSAGHYGLGLTLGNGEVTLAELTNAYAALANDGLFHPLSFFAGDSAFAQGKEANSYGERIFSPQICFLLTDILSDPAARAPAFGLGGPLRLPFPCAAKTGTSKDYRDNWTVGYTTQYTVGVWVGNFDGQPMEKISGVIGAAPLFRDVFLTLHAKSDPQPFSVPQNLIRMEICPKSGKRPGPYCNARTEEWFITETAPTGECTVHRAYFVDARDGLLAGSNTQKENVEERVFEVWPPEYSSWLVANAIPFPPDSYSELSRSLGTRLAISFPDDGDVFKIDPILHPEYQTLQLEALVPPGIDMVEWLVDSLVVARCKRPFSAQWRLTAGSHRLQLKAQFNAAPITSPEVFIRVF